LRKDEESMSEDEDTHLETEEILRENEESLIEGQRYKSPARVLLAGMGIDEQLGGYSRHRYIGISRSFHCLH